MHDNRQVDGVTQREAEERDQHRRSFTKEGAQIVIQVAQGKANQEWQNGADKVVRFERCQTSGTQDHHRHQRAGFQRHQNECAGLFFRAVLVHQAGIQTAVCHIHSGNDRQH